jgi:hypothetical protein
MARSCPLPCIKTFATLDLLEKLSSFERKRIVVATVDQGKIQ